MIELLKNLTKTEFQHVLLILEGLSVTERAKQTSITEYTVRTHTQNIYDKLYLMGAPHSKQYARLFKELFTGLYGKEKWNQFLNDLKKIWEEGQGKEYYDIIRE